MLLLPQAFTVKVGTIFEASHVPMNLSLQAIYLMCASKKGISSNQLHRTLGVTLKAAWFMSHRIREAVRSGDLSPFGQGGGAVEVDEAFIPTDEASQYRGLAADPSFSGHDYVNHGAGEYVRRTAPEVNTNTVEGYYSVFKHGMKSAYQHCGKRHLHRYAAEFDFRYSNRVGNGVNDTARADAVLNGVVGKRLEYEGSC